MRGVSEIQVTRLCEEIDERVNAFLERPIDGDWPYLWIDATSVKVRQNGRIVPVAAIIAISVNNDGRREILGMGIGPTEAEMFWTSFVRKLVRRGLRGVKLVISDVHDTGLSQSDISMSVSSCVVSRRPGVNGTLTSMAASMAAFPSAAQPPSTMRSASDTRILPACLPLNA